MSRKASGSLENRAGFCAIIGRPNVGKSTLMNHLVGQKIAITSKRPQTTRTRIRTVYTDERGQIVFVDTPGMQQPKNRLGHYMESAAEGVLKEVDVILYLVEPGSYIGPQEEEIIEMLKSLTTPVILVINKEDTASKEKLDATEQAYSERLDLERIYRTAALKDKNTVALLEGIFHFLPYGENFYDEDTVTEETERSIAAEIIREKALRLLSDEVPHGIAVEVVSMKERGRLMDIDATIYCEKTSHKGIVIGKDGRMLKRIGTEARKDIEDMLEMQVNLKLWVKVKKNWRENEGILRALGYDMRKL